PTIPHLRLLEETCERLLQECEGRVYSTFGPYGIPAYAVDFSLDGIKRKYGGQSHSTYLSRTTCSAVEMTTPSSMYNLVDLDGISAFLYHLNHTRHTGSSKRDSFGIMSYHPSALRGHIESFIRWNLQESVHQITEPYSNYFLAQSSDKFLQKFPVDISKITHFMYIFMLYRIISHFVVHNHPW
ncbi:hypothetical protein CSKR_200682, partial [Clonorchis sinensis]